MKKILLLIVLFVYCKNNTKKPTIDITIKVKTFKVQLANETETNKQVLMFRKKLNKNAGMLFEFEKEGLYPFWMKNTYIPLSIAFIDKNMVIIDIQNMQPLDTFHYVCSLIPFKYALEMNRGWFKKNNINIGDTVRLNDK